MDKKKYIKLAVGLPIYGGVSPLFFDSIFQLQSKALPFEWQLLRLNGDSLVSRARNNIVQKFLETNCTHLLFIDSDIGFTGDQVIRIVQRGKEIIGGLYPKKAAGNPEWVMNILDGEQVDPDGLLKVRYIGTGFMCIERSVFEHMRHAYKSFQYRPDPALINNTLHQDYFPVGVFKSDEFPQGRYLSEDWYFCELARQLNYEIYADTTINLKHEGTIIYPTVEPKTQPLNPSPQPRSTG